VSAALARKERVFGLKVSPLNRRRLNNFCANRRGFWALWIFLALFGLSLVAEIVANDAPVLVYFDGEVYAPAFRTYSETEFGGEFETEADYRDPFVRDLIDAKGWMLWPPVRYDHRTVAWDLPVPAPSPPGAEHWLGTDDQARDVVARLSTASASRSSSGSCSPSSARSSVLPRAPCRAISAAGPTCCSNVSSRSGPACRCSIC
jgi:microcin C transport system permease protein